MKQILVRLFVVLSILDAHIVLFAQTDNEIQQLCKDIRTSVAKGDSSTAWAKYDTAVDIIEKQRRPDMIIHIEEDVIRAVIESVAESDLVKAKEYAQKALSMRIQCITHFAKEGFFDSKDSYVANISNEYASIGSILADIGLLDDAESCFQFAIDVFPQMHSFPEEYPLSQELMGDFYAKYKADPGRGLEWQYEAFQSAASLFEMDSDIAKQVFGRICASYGMGLAYYSFAGNLGLASQYQEVPIYSYTQIVGLADSWDRIRAHIIKKYGREAYESLVSINPINTIGEERVRFGTPEHDDLFRALSAIHYGKVDEYEKWSEEMLRSISSPEDKIAYTDCLVEALRNKGYINNASNLYKDLQEILKKDDRKDLVLGQALADASMMYSYGQYDYAWASVSDIAWTLNDEAYVPEHPALYIKQLILLGNLYRCFKNNLPAAEQAMICALAIAQSDKSQIDKRILQTIYNNLSTIYNREKDYLKANEAIINAIDCRRQWAIENDCLGDFENGIIWPATFYGKLADNYSKLGDYQNAETQYKRCMDYYSKYYPERPDILGIYDGLVALYEKLGNDELKLQYSRLSLNHLLKTYLAASQGLTKTQRADLWHNYNTGVSDINAQFAINNPAFAGLAYNAALIDKGFLLKLEGIIQDNIRNSGDQNLISAYEQFKDAERRGLESKKQLEDKMMYLYSKHSEFNESISFHHWQDVQSHLTKQDIAIEFATACSDGQNITYAALLLKTGWKEPVIIQLGPEDRYARVLKDGAKAYRNNDELYGLTWKAIEPYLSGIKNIYFAPQGAISQINIEVLENEKGRPINKLYNVYRLSSTGTLCDPKRSYSSSSATLYGGLNYDTSVSELTASSRAYTGIASDVNTAVYFTPDQTRKGWQYLPGTEKEVIQIGSILDTKKIEHLTYTQSQGTEESFKSMNGHSPAILHIATHGFYLDEKNAAKSKPSLLAVEENDSHVYPLRRCGLILSGAQHAWLGESLPNGVEDGILTGEEISGMDLSGSSLVILSACQTALGDIARDGVYGLQRAFKIAGAGTLIMSLWEVSDAATELMMTKFYSLLTTGKSKRDAFDGAVAAVKAKYDGPEYWAAFIMLD